MFSTKTILAAAVCGCLLLPAATSASEGNYVLSDQVLFDETSCMLRINNITVDEVWGLMLNVTCENRTSDTVEMFSLSNASVDGYMINPFWSHEVEPGVSSESSIALSTQEMERYGIVSADEVTLDITVRDSNDYSIDPFCSGSFTIYPTGLSEGSVTYPEYVSPEGSQKLVDNGQVSFTYESQETDDFNGYTLNVYLENLTDLALTYSLNDVTVNGTACNPYWSAVVAPHKKGLAKIAFSNLADYGIAGDVSDISFRLTVSNADDYTADPLVDENFTIHP